MNDAELFATAGPRALKTPGSPAWCRQTLNMLKREYASIESDYHRLEETLSEIEQHQIWNVFPPDAPYGSLDAMLKAEIGTGAQDMRRNIDIAAKRAQELDAADRANVRPAHIHIDRDVDNKQGDINVRPTGTSAAAAIRRLRKDRPDIHARVLAGELSAHAGMREAGFRKPTRSRRKPAVERIRRMIAKHGDELTAADIRSLKEQLDALA